MAKGTVGFVETLEHRRFEKVCRDAERYRYIALCVGPPGVGKTTSGKRYSSWDILEPLASRYAYVEDPPTEVVSRRAAYFCVPPANTPKMITSEIELRCNTVSWLVDVAESNESDEPGELPGTRDHTRLIIVDEAQFLIKNNSLEQLRYVYDHGDFGLVLMGMPGLDEVFARYKQLYSRVGHKHSYRPLDAQHVREILKDPAILGVRLDAAAFNGEAVAAIVRVCKGNFRTLEKLVQRVERVLEINARDVVSAAVVRKASEQLTSGFE